MTFVYFGIFFILTNHLFINMTYQISLGLIEDISRINTQAQNYMLKIQSYNHTFLNSPIFPLNKPTLSYAYTFLASQKQVIRFHLMNIGYDGSATEIASGKFDIRQYISRNNPPQNFNVKLVLDSFYNNEVLLHMRLKKSSEVRSRNDGLKQISRPNNTSTNLLDRSVVSNSNHSSFYNPEMNESKEVLFKGACNNRNFFSFLDPVFKGQTYNFIEPPKK